MPNHAPSRGACDVKDLHWTNYASVTDKTPEQRDQLLRDTEHAFAALRPATAE